MKFYIANPERPIITIKGTINQDGPFNFIFDTGASMTVIEKQTAAKLGLYEKAESTKKAHGAGGALSSSIVIIESIKVGNVEAKNIQAGVLDLSNLTKCGCIEEFAGILGYNFMKDHKVIIDYPKQEIHFE
ncbi:MAG: clan AA aspartic protease [Candidatus Bathyarchaeota archaeon]|nr:MAG: clan AA aspartic protease [Candidatus Bathyarchaeota archaeon]